MLFAKDGSLFGGGEVAQSNFKSTARVQSANNKGAGDPNNELGGADHKTRRFRSKSVERSDLKAPPARWQQPACITYYNALLPSCDDMECAASGTWVVVKIMVPFWVPFIIRHLIFRVPKKGP